MVCGACGGASFDAQGICQTCGAAQSASVAAPGVKPVGVRLTIPEPTPAPNVRGTRPSRGDDPASTNPGSGVFCGRCGSTVDVRGDYCGICGNPLNDAAYERMRQARHQSRALAPAPDNPAKRPLAPTAQQTNPATSYTPASPSVPWVKIVVLFLFMLALAGGLVSVTLLAHHH